MTRSQRLGRLAAIPAGYALTSLAAAALVRALPIAPAEAVSVGFVSFFAIYAALILWAYGTRRPARMWAWWAAAAALLGAFVWWSIAAAGRA